MTTTAAGPQASARTRLADDAPVLFFDGDCGLCSRLVRLLVAIDRRGVFRLAPLQGATARRRGLTPTGPAETWRLVLAADGQVWEGADAVLRSVARLGGAWRMAWLLLAAPRPLREAMYRFVARHRRRWFGRGDVCQTAGPRVRSRLLE